MEVEEEERELVRNFLEYYMMITVTGEGAAGLEVREILLGYLQFQNVENEQRRTNLQMCLLRAHPELQYVTLEGASTNQQCCHVDPLSSET